MKTVLIANQKGGVGKSLIADELAFHFERDGIPISFFDLDNQGGTIHETQDADNAQVAIVDTPGALTEHLRDYINESDLIICPTRPSSRDIEPLERILEITKSCNKPAYVVINASDRFTPSRDFELWFAENHADTPYDKLPNTVQFIKAAAAGKSIIEIDRKCAGALAIEKIYRTCRLALNM